MAIVRSVSLSEADANLVDDMELSLSGLLKQRIQQIREESINFEKREDLWRKKTTAMQQCIDDLNKKIQQLEGNNV